MSFWPRQRHERLTRLGKFYCWRFMESVGSSECSGSAKGLSRFMMSTSRGIAAEKTFDLDAEMW